MKRRARAQPAPRKPRTPRASVAPRAPLVVGGETVAAGGAASTARRRVRRLLEQLILGGKVAPGAKLRQQQLAGQFGVAQNVVREALLELEAVGLVYSIDHRGVFAAELGVEKLLEAYEVREMHEALAVRRCCQRATRQQLAELRQWAGQIHQLSQGRGQSAAGGALDRQWHRRLLEIAGNAMLLRLAENYLLLGKVVGLNYDPERTRREHLAIVEAIEAGDAAGAEAQIRLHIRGAREAIAAQAAGGQFVPRWLVDEA